MKHPVFFEYIFYRAYRYYVSRKDLIPKESSVIFLSLVQMFNILTIFFLFDFIIWNKLVISKILGLIVAILVYILNKIQFKGKKYIEVLSRWENELPQQKRKRGFLVAFYIIGSFIFCIGIAIYIGSNHK